MIQENASRNFAITWQDYEDAVLKFFECKFQPPTFRVCGTRKGTKHYIRGRYSDRKRQLDVAVYRAYEDHPFLVADAKRHTNPLDIKRIESFIGMLDDVGAKIGVLACPKGFSRSAYKRAKAVNVELKIVTEEEALAFRDLLDIVKKIFPLDWSFHPDISLALSRLKTNTEPYRVIDSIENIPFDEWIAFVKYSLARHQDEAITFLRFVAHNHPNDGWRFNAIQQMIAVGRLTQSDIEQIVAQESDRAIIRMLQDYQLIPNTDENHNSK